MTTVRQTLGTTLQMRSRNRIRIRFRIECVLLATNVAFVTISSQHRHQLPLHRYFQPLQAVKMGSIEPPQPEYDVLVIGAGLSG